MYFYQTIVGSLFEHIQHHPLDAQRLIGLKYEQLEQLLEQAREVHNQKQVSSESKKVRIIAGGGGRRPKLSLEEQIILTLTYLRHLTTFQLLGIQFGVSETTANDTFNYWFPILGELLPPSLLEQVKKNSSDYQVVQEILTEFELIVDSYEQPRERPGEYEEQKEYYSGKKKNHTMKNQIIVLPEEKDIIDVVAGKPGTKSDINLFREHQKGFDPNQRFHGDKAYAGEESIKTPTKKPKKQELTPEQKERNKELAKERIFVEHLIRVVKIFRVAQERFRLNPNKYEQIIMTICGLVRLRLGTLVFSS
ncbi:IS5/IS1182 family transposase [Mastigocladopsis repens]|uniref:IS5/IS1182 family transposase n=1 Tax=Mastigocladopsis repens TaxID=221287 RepID=UPI0002E2DA94|nr:IS5/IS1182 family transposase [Mastigocladopsis repens]